MAHVSLVWMVLYWLWILANILIGWLALMELSVAIWVLTLGWWCSHCMPLPFSCQAPLVLTLGEPSYRGVWWGWFLAAFHWLIFSQFYFQRQGLALNPRNNSFFQRFLKATHPTIATTEKLMIWINPISITFPWENHQLHFQKISRVSSAPLENMVEQTIIAHVDTSGRDFNVLLTQDTKFANIHWYGHQFQEKHITIWETPPSKS